MGNSDTSGQHINYIPPFARCFMSDAIPTGQASANHPPGCARGLPSLEKSTRSLQDGDQQPGQ